MEKEQELCMHLRVLEHGPWFLRREIPVSQTKPGLDGTTIFPLVLQDSLGLRSNSTA